MTEAHIFGELVVVLGAAVVVVLVLSALRLPTIAGFIVAGAIIGPGALGWVSEPGQIDILAEIGVVLLLFTIGLEFSLSELRRIGRLVAVGGGLQVGLTTLATLAVATALGLSPQRGLFYGFLVALSSTAIVLRALAERGETDAPHGRLIVGALLFQDLCVVPMMLVAPLLAGGPGGLAVVPVVLGKAALLVAATLVLARLVVPRALHLVARTRRRDLFVLAVLLICAGIAWLTSAAGLSLPLGAFLAGVVLADSVYGHQALADVLPLRDTLSSVFFISMGMLLDFGVLASRPLGMAALVVAILAGKTAFAALAGLMMRFPLRVAVLAGVGLAQVGEFSFVLAKLGNGLGLVGETELRFFLAASVVTMIVTPVAVRLGPHLAAGAGRLAVLERLLGIRDTAPELEAGLSGHVVIMGYGVGGRLLAEALRSTGIPYVLVDIHAERVRAARAQGESALYGDVTSPEILIRARVESARQVVVLINDPDAIRRAVRVTRRLAPRVPILVRTRYLGEMKPLMKAGATDVVVQEFEASVEVIAQVLRTSAIPRNVISERIRHARRSGPATERAVTIPRRTLGESRELDELRIESFLVNDGAWIAGRSVAQSELRRRTGVTLLALSREGSSAIHPVASDLVEAGDILYLVGGGGELAEARRLLERGPDGPAGPATGY
jgi:CPA2 family monovalent cation:H+ antiporter-2